MSIPILPGDSILINAYLEERGEAHIGAQGFGLMVSDNIEILTKAVIGNPIYSAVSLACLGLAVRSFLSPDIDIDNITISTVRDARLVGRSGGFLDVSAYKNTKLMGLIYSFYSFTTALPVLGDYEKRINE